MRQTPNTPDTSPVLNARPTADTAGTMPTGRFEIIPPPDRMTQDAASPSARLVLTGSWLSHDSALPDCTVEALAPMGEATTLACDVSGVTGWDTGLIAFLWDVRRLCDASQRVFDATLLPHPMQQLLDLLPDQAGPATPKRKPRQPVLEHVGGKAIDVFAETGIVAGMASRTALAAFRSLFRRVGLRRSDLFSDLFNAGPSALLIVGVVNFLVGAILAFVGAVQLQKFAAGIYVASLVGIATVREMAAVMTAIIMAGRTGGAYAARISTMQGNEEIDALKVFGISVSSYLILPAVLSLVVTMPFLYLYGCLIGMLGGYVVAISMLDITSLGYFHQTVIAFGIGQFIFGFVKSIVFGAFIGLTSCRIGLKAGRSAADVGIAATRAVVIGIVGVIALDAIFAVIANSLGV
ncbi:ABC transporter permease [Asaia bogorensis NBRC 16594]|uniref:ABC transporter n=2 Tax=Asaia bogorensis TaxID=91915 RepID=A0AAN4R0X1_9PROT|nr:ABC transporter permease [Asaia bogorensis]BAT20432.1 ABC transporter [Asaia bogorensis NBRC 16594]GBQ79335.1 ABC transporter permease [Asaia bogorensis NBRC 16594]GEL52145.1 hypothetical protein ABO01nite_01520 [Asaia bogorensis NBRC 16594]